MPSNERLPGTNFIVPDPAASYGREKPEAESGMGKLQQDETDPSCCPDREESAVPNRQPLRQINTDDELDTRDRKRAADQPLFPPPGQPDHSLCDEEPLGEDLVPLDIHNPQMKRYPRTEGKGGTP